MHITNNFIIINTNYFGIRGFFPYLCCELKNRNMKKIIILLSIIFIGFTHNTNAQNLVREITDECWIDYQYGEEINELYKVDDRTLKCVGSMDANGYRTCLMNYDYCFNRLKGEYKNSKVIRDEVNLPMGKFGMIALDYEEIVTEIRKGGSVNFVNEIRTTSGLTVTLKLSCNSERFLMKMAIQ